VLVEQDFGKRLEVEWHRGGSREGLDGGKFGPPRMR
jgi:hypothetical protein